MRIFMKQSDLSSRYSSNKSSQSREDLQLPIVTAHLKTFHTQHASLPYDTITVTAEHVTPYTDINQSSSIPQHAVTCSAQEATLTTHTSSLKYTVPGCDPHSHNSLQPLFSVELLQLQFLVIQYNIMSSMMRARTVL